MAMIHVNRSGASLGVFEEEKVREGLRTGEFIGTDLGWMEGMPTWRPLSELESFRTPPPPQQAAAPEPAAQPIVTTPVAATSAGRTGLPWENRSGSNLVNALFDTITLIFTKPQDAFAVMRREGGFGDPLLYVLILAIAAAIISAGWSLLLPSFGSLGDGGLGWLGAGVGSLFMIVLMPVIMIVAMFIGAALVHLCLMLLGGANQPYETTFRVACYAHGTATVLQVVPFCGGLLAFAASVAFNTIGLARAHETDTWKALVAVLLPMVLCCGGVALIMIMFFGALAGSADWR